MSNTRICRNWSQTGDCRFGHTCHYAWSHSDQYRLCDAPHMRMSDSATPEIPDEPDFDNAMDKFLDGIEEHDTEGSKTNYMDGCTCFVEGCNGKLSAHKNGEGVVMYFTCAECGALCTNS